MNDFFNSIAKDGLKVTASVDNSVYWKLGATIVAAVLFATLSSVLVKGIFTN